MVEHAFIDHFYSSYDIGMAALVTCFITTSSPLSTLEPFLLKDNITAVILCAPFTLRCISLNANKTP